MPGRVSVSNSNHPVATLVQSSRPQAHSNRSSEDLTPYPPGYYPMSFPEMLNRMSVCTSTDNSQRPYPGPYFYPSYNSLYSSGKCNASFDSFYSHTERHYFKGRSSEVHNLSMDRVLGSSCANITPSSFSLYGSICNTSVQPQNKGGLRHNRNNTGSDLESDVGYGQIRDGPSRPRSNSPVHNRTVSYLNDTGFSNEVFVNAARDQFNDIT